MSMERSDTKKYDYYVILSQKIMSVLKNNSHHFMDSSEITHALGYEREVKTCRTYKYTEDKYVPADKEFEIININVKGILEKLHNNGEIDQRIMNHRNEELIFYKIKD